ncbi:MAG: hypothetical protein Q9160_005110 [Pyrenula sp. 1 TL-2023]
MSSEQRYDCSYAQFVQDDLPSLDLFGDPTLSSVSDAFPDSLFDEYLANSQLGGQSYYSDEDIPEQGTQSNTMGNIAGNSDLNALTTPESPTPSASTPSNLAMTCKVAEPSVLVVETLRGEGDESQTIKNDVYYSQMSESDAAQPSLRQTCSVPSTDEAKLNRDLAPEALFESLQTGPINEADYLAAHKWNQALPLSQDL